MQSMPQRPPSVNNPVTGLTLLPRENLPHIEARYAELEQLESMKSSPAIVYFRAVRQQIRELQRSSSNRTRRGGAFDDVRRELRRREALGVGVTS
jgi:hypothetical protein